MANSISTAAGYELNLEEYWQIILRRRWVILFCAFSLCAFSWLFTWMNQPPPLYASSASVKITQSTDMTGLLLQNLTFSSVDDMSTQLSLVKSYALMERVAMRLGLIPKNLTSADIRSNPSYMGEVLDLKDDVDAEQEGSSGIITIKTTSSSAEFARDLAQAVAEEFRTFNIEEKNKRVFEAKRFIQQQLVVVGDRLKKAEEAVRDYREKNNLSSAGQGSEVMGKVVADLEQEYRHQSGHLNDLRFALPQLKERVQRKRWDYKAVTVSGKVSPYFDELNKRLVEMALKHTELSTNFTDEHPQIQELRLQANDILSSMVDELAKQVGLTRQRMADLQKSIEAAEQKYQGLPEQALELRRLERAVGTNEDLFNLLEKKYQEVLIKEAEKVEEVSLLRPAFISHVRINPVRTRQTAIAGFILGLVLGLIISLVLEAMDTSVGTIEEVESFLEVPVIGFVPHLAHDEAVELFSGMEGLATSGQELERQIRLVTHFAPPSSIAEAYRSMRTNLLFSQSGEHRVILVTSATIKEGKSTVSANLAMVVAQQGARVLIIDADMRKPLQHKTFGLQREPGLDQLDIITCGRKTTNPPDLLAAPAMGQLLEQARSEYDMVIVDMPPLLHTTDATIVAGKVDGVLLVYHIGAVVRGALKRVKTGVESVGGKVLGVVLNGVRGELSSDYANYKMDRYYAYAYGEHAEERGNWLDRANTHVHHVFRKCYKYALDWIRGRGHKGRS